MQEGTLLANENKELYLVVFNEGGHVGIDDTEEFFLYSLTECYVGLGINEVNIDRLSMDDNSPAFEYEDILKEIL